MNILQLNDPAIWRFAFHVCLFDTEIIVFRLGFRLHTRMVSGKIQNHLVAWNVVSIAQCLNFGSVWTTDSQHWRGFYEWAETDSKSKIFDSGSDLLRPEWSAAVWNHPSTKGLSRSHCIDFSVWYIVERVYSSHHQSPKRPYPRGVRIPGGSAPTNRQKF